ncbi:MAG: hypothetical protein OXI26_12395 [bacterium]|nr:hypothetical protein [bacterium]
MLVVALLATGCGSGDGASPSSGAATEAAPATEAPAFGGDDPAVITSTAPAPVAGSTVEPAEPATPATTTTPGTSIEALIEDADALPGIGESAEGAAGQEIVEETGAGSGQASADASAVTGSEGGRAEEAAVGDLPAGADDQLSTGTAPAGPEEEAALEVVVSEDVPDVEMLDVSTGSTVGLRSVVTGHTPLLFWFWSPL